MKRLFLASFFVLFLSLITASMPRPVLALENPINTTNNKVGIHILFTDEIADAAKLVNANGGDWGYVTIPIQAGDRDIVKWQKFMDDARKFHVIPIIRLATEGDYFNTKVWRKPNAADILDFANFLSSLDWPTANRYVIVFNEVNRSDEWGGATDPVEYADLLSYAATIFKSENQNYFIISSGMDNASITIPGQSYNEFDFFKLMNKEVPGIFNQVDGMSSHSYPNPGFSQPSSKQTAESIATFRFEEQFISQISNKDLPVFITETGWKDDVLSENTIAAYYTDAFTSVWSDKNVVAVTPFLLRASGPFAPFSFLHTDGSQTEFYKAIYSLPKVKGSPALSPRVLAAAVPQPIYAIKNFSGHQDQMEEAISVPTPIKIIFKWIMKW